MVERFFIIYDFVSDKRRARLVRILEKYGVRVQYSIFEFYLTKARKIELFAAMKKGEFLEDKKNSALMIIPVPKDYEDKIRRYGDTVDVLGQPGLYSI